jgi:hypothetical protein
LTTPENQDAVHLTDEQVAGYVDRILTDSERDKIEHHMAVCDECRIEVRAAVQLVRFNERKKMWYRGSWVLAAAAALVALVITDPFSAGESEVSTFRASNDPLDVGDRVIAVVFPEQGAALTGDSLRFIWHPAEPEVRYRFTLSNMLGEEIWSVDTADTALAIPGDITLEPAVTYVWYVDGLLLDGSSITTGTRRFELIP